MALPDSRGDNRNLPRPWVDLPSTSASKKSSASKLACSLVRPRTSRALSIVRRTSAIRILGTAGLPNNESRFGVGILRDCLPPRNDGPVSRCRRSLEPVLSVAEGTRESHNVSNADRGNEGRLAARAPVPSPPAGES